MKTPSRTGAASRVSVDITRRLAGVRALWLAVQNDPALSVEKAAPEFYFAVGALLEGCPVANLELRKISPARVAAHLQDYKES